MWCNPDYDTLIYDALETADTESRKRIYQQVNQLVYDQVPLVPIAHALRYQAYRYQPQRDNAFVGRATCAP
jgi:cationic peptide transport system substrate-binding protein